MFNLPSAHIRQEIRPKVAPPRAETWGKKGDQAVQAALLGSGRGLYRNDDSEVRALWNRGSLNQSCTRRHCTVAVKPLDVRGYGIPVSITARSVAERVARPVINGAGPPCSRVSYLATRWRCWPPMPRGRTPINERPDGHGSPYTEAQAMEMRMLYAAGLSLKTPPDVSYCEACRGWHINKVTDKVRPDTA